MSKDYCTYHFSELLFLVFLIFRFCAVRWIKLAISSAFECT